MSHARDLRQLVTLLQIPDDTPTPAPGTEPPRHQPKGGMCMTCVHGLSRNCSNLPFSTMPVIGSDPMPRDASTVLIVRCTEFVRMPSGSEAERGVESEGGAA